jgi:hypothetical protein
VEMSMRNKQQGMTAIGMAVVLSMVVVIGYAGFMVMPIYLETTKVDTIMNDAVRDFDGKATNATYIRSAIGKRLNIETVNTVSTKDFKIKPVDRNFEVSVAYDREVRFVGNLYLLVRYDKTVEISQ